MALDQYEVLTYAEITAIASNPEFRPPAGFMNCYISSDDKFLYGIDSDGNINLLSEGTRGKLIYKAKLVQVGTNAPVATILENTLGGVPVWSYDSTGYYLLTLAGAFAGNVVVTTGDEFDNDCYAISFPGSYTDDQVNLFVSLLSAIGAGSDGRMNGTTFTVEVYPL